jgi:hypothetical protein
LLAAGGGDAPVTPLTPMQGSEGRVCGAVTVPGLCSVYSAVQYIHAPWAVSNLPTYLKVSTYPGWYS